VGDLPQRMHAGIRPPGAVEFDRLLGHLLQRAGNEILHGIATRLGLPSIIRATVVGNGELEAHLSLLVFSVQFSRESLARVIWFQFSS
jgi:hypothetical protein